MIVRNKKQLINYEVYFFYNRTILLLEMLKINTRNVIDASVTRF